MKNKNRFVIAVVTALLVTMLVASVASAHNAGHIFTPDGRCQNVGSLKESPDVSDSNPNLNTTSDPGQLDLLPGTGDQYGARFAATRGNSAVLPGACP